MRSFASPGEPKDAITLALLPSSNDDKPKEREDTALPLAPPSISDTPQPHSLNVTISKMRSFASPGEPKEAVTLAPLSSSYDDETNQRKDTALPPVPPSISDAPPHPSSNDTVSKMRSFANPGDPKEAITLAPLSSSYDENSMQCEQDTASPPLPSPMVEVPKNAFSFACTSKMRSFACPGVPWKGSVLAPVSSSNEGSSEPTMSSGPRWPLFTQYQAVSTNVANFHADSSSDASRSGSTPASESTSSL